MLQIISGKLFEAGHPVNEREEDAVLHANYSWVQPIRTEVAELRPIEYGGTPIATYAVRYKSRYQPTEGDILVHPNAAPAIEQLRRLATIWFRAIFHPDLVYVETLCRGHHRHSHSEIVPRNFVQHFFDVPKRGTADEVTGFSNFVDKVIGLPRQTFKAYMASVSMFADAIESISTNFDLAYSMFVYLLEALGQSSAPYIAEWEDYDQNVRVRLDPLLAQLPGDAAANIRETLLRGQQLKLTKRFKGFVQANLEDSFFTDEASDISRALPKSQLDHALGNLYKTRSGFVHELRKVHDQLHMPTFEASDIFTWGNDTFLTMSGVVRLTRHVLLTFARKSPFLATENYPEWRRELPGIITVQFAPHLWIWQAENFTPPQAAMRLSGLLESMTTELIKPEPILPNLTALMTRIEGIVDQAGPSDRMTLIAIYSVYNRAMAEELRHPGYREFLGRHLQELQCCHVGFLAGDVLTTANLHRWPVADCVDVFTQYLKTRHRENAINLPVVLEAAIALAIANLYLAQNQFAEYRYWANRAIFDLAGHRAAQTIIADQLTGQAELPVHVAIGAPQDEG